MWDDLWYIFHQFSWFSETSKIATSIMRNACFCSSRPPILALKIHPEIMFFQDAFLDTLLVDVMLVLYKNNRFWDPFKIQWAPTSDPKSTKWRPIPTFFVFERSPFSSPDLFSHVGRPLVQCWYPFGSNWLHFASLSDHFQWCFMFLAPTFEPTIAKHAPSPAN